MKFALNIISLTCFVQCALSQFNPQILSLLQGGLTSGSTQIFGAAAAGNSYQRPPDLNPGAFGSNSYSPNIPGGALGGSLLGGASGGALSAACGKTCEDKNKLFCTWKSGECNKRTIGVIFQITCPKTCGRCPVCPLYARPCEPAKKCKDVNPSCYVMANRCRASGALGQYVKSTCRVTCGECRACPETPKRPTPVRCLRTCRDEHDDCLHWSRSKENYCAPDSEYADWMSKNCRESCGICKRCETANSFSPRELGPPPVRNPSGPSSTNQRPSRPSKPTSNPETLPPLPKELLALLENENKETTNFPNKYAATTTPTTKIPTPIKVSTISTTTATEKTEYMGTTEKQLPGFHPPGLILRPMKPAQVGKPIFLPNGRNPNRYGNGMKPNGHQRGGNKPNMPNTSSGSMYNKETSMKNSSDYHNKVTGFGFGKPMYPSNGMKPSHGMNSGSGKPMYPSNGMNLGSGKPMYPSSGMKPASGKPMYPSNGMKPTHGMNPGSGKPMYPSNGMNPASGKPMYPSNGMKPGSGKPMYPSNGMNPGSGKPMYPSNGMKPTHGMNPGSRKPMYPSNGMNPGSGKPMYPSNGMKPTHGMNPGSGKPMYPINGMNSGSGTPMYPSNGMTPGSGKPMYPSNGMNPGSGKPMYPSNGIKPGSGKPMYPSNGMNPGSGKPMYPSNGMKPGSGKPMYPGKGTKPLYGMKPTGDGMKTQNDPCAMYKSMSSTTLVDQCLSAHNYYRCLHGANPLDFDVRLAASAQIYAERMATEDVTMENLRSKMMELSQDENLMFMITMVDEDPERLKDEAMEPMDMIEEEMTGEDIDMIKNEMSEMMKEDMDEENMIEGDVIEGDIMEGDVMEEDTMEGDMMTETEILEEELMKELEMMEQEVNMMSEEMMEKPEATENMSEEEMMKYMMNKMESIDSKYNMAKENSDMMMNSVKNGEMIEEDKKQESDDMMRSQSARMRIPEKEIGINVGISAGDNKNYGVYEAVVDWYAERLNYMYGQDHGMNSKRFTQLVWKNTTKVGCGLAKMGSKMIVVAHYYSKGNIPELYEENVSDMAKGCSRNCSMGSCLSLKSPHGCNCIQATPITSVPVCRKECVISCKKPSYYQGPWQHSCRGSKLCTCSSSPDTANGYLAGAWCK